MQDVVLHLGFPKTGTTSLQQRIFASAGSDPDLAILGVHPDGVRSTPNAFLRLRRHTFGLRPRRIPPRVVWPASLVGSRSRVLLTDETMIGHAIHRAITTDRPGDRVLDGILHRLRALLPSGARVRLLVTVRSQDLLVPSLLAQNHHRLPSSRRSVAAVLPLIEDRSTLLSRLLDFRWTSDRAMRALGAESITYLPLELLTEDAARYWSVVAGLLGLPEQALDPGAAGGMNVRRVTETEWRTSTGGLAAPAYRLYARLPLPLPPEALKRRISIPVEPRTTADSPRVTVTPEQRRRILAVHGDGYRALLASVGLAWTPSVG